MPQHKLPHAKQCLAMRSCSHDQPLAQHELPHLADDDVNLFWQLHCFDDSLDDRDLVSQLQAEEEPPQQYSPTNTPPLNGDKWLVSSVGVVPCKQLCSQLLAQNTKSRAIRKA